MADDRPASVFFFAPFVSSTMAIEPGWIDYNGHLNMAYYHVLFDRAVDEAFGVVGLGTDSLRAVATTPTVWLGLVLFGLSAVVWLGVLSRVSLSFAYPFASLTYVVIVVVDRFVLGQSVPSARWIGVAAIVAGILVIARTSAHG